MNIIAFQDVGFFAQFSDPLRSRSLQLIPTLFVDPEFFTSHCRRILYPGSVYPHLSSLYIYTMLCKRGHFSGNSSWRTGTAHGTHTLQDPGLSRALVC